MTVLQQQGWVGISRAAFAAGSGRSTVPMARGSAQPLQRESGAATEPDPVRTAAMVSAEPRAHRSQGECGRMGGTRERKRRDVGRMELSRSSVPP